MPPSDGREFGKYKLLGRIATGGMAEIYRARMTAAAGVTKPVVIKKILPHYAGNRAFVSLFINEARITAGLSHGNIVQVFDFGEVDGEYFLAMEWVHGHALSRVLRRAREKGMTALPPPMALTIAIEMLKGLAYAHTRLDESGRPLGLVHRDVSPQNVLVSYEGQVKLTDFGIARARLAGAPEEGGAQQGKYVYFAPEQARGREPDARADIFAAGTVLYEMLCGRLPFQGPEPEVMRQIALGDFPRPRALNPGVPPALERLVLTAMAPEPGQRFPTAQAFHEALSTYLHTAVPDFTPSALAHFMGYLFEPELVAEDRPVQLPRDFLERLARWNQGLPGSISGPLREPPPRPSASEDSEERVTQPLPHTADAPEPPSSQAPVRLIQLASTEQAGPRRRAARREGRLDKTLPLGQRGPRLRRLLRTLAPAGMAALVGFLLVTMETTGRFAVELNSSPPGARVRLNGQDWYARTPTLITHLDAETEHLIEVHHEGYREWSQRVRAERGSTLAVHARLQPEHPPEAAAPPAQPSPVQHEAHYPLPGFAVFARHHALPVPPSPAARVGLDPRKSYEVSTASRTPAAHAPDSAAEVIYVLEGSPRLPAREAFGIVSPRARKVRHASALYLFVLGKPVEAEAIEVRVREEQSGAVTTVRVDTSGNAVALEPAARFTLRGLDPSATYELRVRDAESPAHTRGLLGARVGQLLCVEGGASTRRGHTEPREQVRVLAVGQPHHLTGAEWMHCTFPDDDVNDNSGALLIDILPVTLSRPPARPPTRKRG